MAKGLVLIGPRYNLIVCLFFIPYVLFQPPATVILRKVGPRNFLPAITILWGACMIVCLPLSALKGYPNLATVLWICQKMGSDAGITHCPWHT